YNQDGTEGARWNIQDAIPAKYKTTKVSAEGKDLFKETVEIAHSGLVRANI
ncbi:MAG: phage tail protein, partial [Cyanobacteria bacterium J06633_2]